MNLVALMLSFVCLTRHGYLFLSQGMFEDHQNPEEIETPGTLEADMLLSGTQWEYVVTSAAASDGTETFGSSEQSRRRSKKILQKRKIIFGDKYRWPKGIVPFKFEDGFKSYAQAAVLKAMDYIEKHTCIRFKPYSKRTVDEVGHDDYIFILDGKGCYSYVGRQRRGLQQLSIGKRCIKRGTVVHELLHALGLYHEQSRPDRDSFVTILYDKIKPSRLRNFKTYDTFEDNLRGIPYDLTSVMHYGGTFSAKKRGDITMETKDSSMQYRIGQRVQLSFIDIVTLNSMYPCSDGCTKVDFLCENQGLVFRNCVCLCPGGLAGERCSEAAPSVGACGGTYTALTGTITSPHYPGNYGHDSKCNWLIKGPPGATIKLVFEDFDLEPDGKWCRYDYLEVKSNGVQHGGPRYCGTDFPRSISYHGDSLVLQFSSDIDENYRGFKLSYTIINSKKVDGQWSSWQYWSACSNGHKMRTRKCNNPAPRNGGRKCKGHLVDYLACS